MTGSHREHRSARVHIRPPDLTFLHRPPEECAQAPHLANRCESGIEGASRIGGYPHRRQLGPGEERLFDIGGVGTYEMPVTLPHAGHDGVGLYHFGSGGLG